MAKAAASSTAGPTKPVYALVGEDSFLQLEKLRAIASRLPADVQRTDFEGPSVELAAVLDELRSFSMFGGDTKLVVVRDADDFVSKYREQLEDYIAKPSESATLVLRLTSLPATQRIYKAIAKVGAVESCAPPKAGELPNWVMTRGREVHDVQVTPEAARLLVDLIGNDMGKLDNELAKLALQVEPGQKVTPDAISGNVSFQREREMWDLTNAVAAGQTAEALRRWRQLIHADPSAEFRAVTWLGMWLGEVGAVLVDANAAKSKFGWKHRAPGAWEKFVKSAQTLGRSGHARALDLLTEIDRQTKSGVGDAAENVERFILTLAARG